MSWSLYATAKAGPGVQASIIERFNAINYLKGDEALLKDSAANIVANAVNACSPGSFVHIECSGSASEYNGQKTQTLKLSVQPLHGDIIA